jgi:hypothetical protein
MSDKNHDARDEFFSDRFDEQRDALVARTVDAAIAAAAHDAAQRDQSWIAGGIVVAGTIGSTVFGDYRSEAADAGVWFAWSCGAAFVYLMLTRGWHEARAAARLRRVITRATRR